MQSEIFKRINTGLILFLLLILMFISKTVYLFVSICVFTLSFIEFTKMSKLFLKNSFRDSIVLAEISKLKNSKKFM